MRQIISWQKKKNSKLIYNNFTTWSIQDKINWIACIIGVYYACAYSSLEAMKGGQNWRVIIIVALKGGAVAKGLGQGGKRQIEKGGAVAKGLGQGGQEANRKRRDVSTYEGRWMGPIFIEWPTEVFLFNVQHFFFFWFFCFGSFFGSNWPQRKDACLLGLCYFHKFNQ